MRPVAISIAVALSLFHAIGCSRDKIEVIPPAMVGILINANTKELINPEALGEGVIRIKPDERIILFSLLEDTMTFAGSAMTIDSSSVSYRISITYVVHKSKVAKLYSDFGTNYSQIFVEPCANEVVREVLFEKGVIPNELLKNLIFDRLSLILDEDSIILVQIIFLEINGEQ